jgi:uncharacterized protein YaaQ
MTIRDRLEEIEVSLMQGIEDQHYESTLRAIRNYCNRNAACVATAKNAAPTAYSYWASCAEWAGRLESQLCD